MKTLILSDIHMGSPLFNSQHKILDLLSDTYKDIFLIGDIIDIWEQNLNKTLEYYDPLISAINQKAKECPVTIIKGNHDPDFLTLKRIFKQCIVKEQYAYIPEKKIMLMHGDEFDYFINDYSCLASFLYKIHQFVSKYFEFNLREHFRYLFYSIASKKDKNYFKDLVLRIEKETIKKYGSDYKTIIMGHTHLPKITFYPETGPIWRNRYVNCGDWVFNNSYVIYCNTTDRFILKQFP